MGVFSTGTQKASFTGCSLLRVRTGEKIGARIRFISLNLSIGGNIPFFHIGNYMLWRTGGKNCPNSFTNSYNGERKTSKNLITCGIDKMRDVRFIIFLPLSKKLTLTMVFWQGLVGSFGNNTWRKQPRLQGHWQELGEVQIYCILANRAIIKRILHRN